ncbi:MAG: hypothetical protein HQ497_07425 [SAR86 cluster bacterium]|uniref:Uncharacterized protein n=1 Tax=SAR86 cluster bacterium TaxID=2030880 RepID=A0A972VVT6_9GAMM|nr:hypothetical protein [SAR86 cluster bacterium]
MLQYLFDNLRRYNFYDANIAGAKKGTRRGYTQIASQGNGHLGAKALLTAGRFMAMTATWSFNSNNNSWVPISKSALM